METQAKQEPRRITKCQKRIMEAFYDLRSTRELEDLTVVELCAKADVNKSTFYTYYRDIYDLSDKLQAGVIERIVESFDHPEFISDDPETFCRNVLMTVQPDSDLISVLFSGSQAYKLPSKLEATVKELYYRYKPECRGDVEHDLKLSYCTYGAFYAYQVNGHLGHDDRISYISKFVGKTKGDLPNAR